MSDFISKTIAGILSHGISLHLESEEEEQYYLIKLQEYFVTETDFPAYLRGERSLEIEDSQMQIALEVIIQESTMYLLPYSQEVFEVFTEILKFIANCHVDIMSEFRGQEVTKIESITEVNKNKDEETDERTETEEESDGDDDYEWI
jgi:hypothetical protein